MKEGVCISKWKDEELGPTCKGVMKTGIFNQWTPSFIQCTLFSIYYVQTCRCMLGVGDTMMIRHNQHWLQIQSSVYSNCDWKVHYQKYLKPASKRYVEAHTLWNNQRWYFTESSHSYSYTSMIKQSKIFKMYNKCPLFRRVQTEMILIETMEMNYKWHETNPSPGQGQAIKQSAGP